jgi:hypothetical protein
MRFSSAVQITLFHGNVELQQTSDSLYHTAGMTTDETLSDAVFKSHIQQSLDVSCVIRTNPIQLSIHPTGYDLLRRDAV